MRGSSLSPQNVPFGENGNFKLAIFKTQKTQKEPLNLLLYPLKGIHIEKPPGRELLSQITTV